MYEPFLIFLWTTAPSNVQCEAISDIDNQLLRLNQNQVTFDRCLI